MKRIDFSQLAHYKKRNFVPNNADLEDESIVKSLYERLLEREIRSDKEFDQWFKDMSELEIALDELGSKLYIEMTSQTDNVEFSKQYKSFVENILPNVKDYEDKLNKRYLRENENFSLEKDVYEIYRRDIS